MKPLAGKSALVTGASRGIGRAIALRLARDGARVAVNFAQSAAAAEALASEIGGIAIQADIGSLTEIEAMFNFTAHTFGGLDIVVNNSGVCPMHSIADTPLEDYERAFAVNTRGAFFCMQQAARRLPDGGRVVNISSGATVASPPGYGIYCASKAALEQFSRVLARELAPRNITVNTVSPGFTETDMFREDPARAGFAVQMTPLGRLGQPEDIADVVAWLCSRDGRWITGQNIQAGGGLNMP